MRGIHVYICIVTLFLSGCSLPTSGPSREAVVKSFQGRLVNVDEATATRMNAADRQEREDKDQQNLTALRRSYRRFTPLIQNGDQIDVKISSFTPDTVTSTGQDKVLEGFQIKELGLYIVDETGSVDLPYVGRMRLSGQSIVSARQAIQIAYDHAGLFVRPYALLTVQGNGRNGIAVAGDVSNPKVLAWQPGGVDLATALTLTDGGEQESSKKNNETRILVNIVRDGATYSIPYDTALRDHIPLVPGDRLVVRRIPSVRATVMGGGILQNGTYSFPNTPSLMEVVARAGGFNANNADITNLFVFRRIDHEVRVLRIDFKSGTGVTTAAALPVKDDDVIYAPEARIVPWLRVMNIAFQLALPAAVMR